jgi:hypothetical protein
MKIQKLFASFGEGSLPHVDFLIMNTSLDGILPL